MSKREESRPDPSSPQGGFDDVAVAAVKAGRVYEQADGATAYVSQVGRDSFDLIVENADGAIVTAKRGLTADDIQGLARNYGWSG